MSQIEVAGQLYRCGKIPALQQFHVVRRLGPALVVAGISVEMLRTGMRMSVDELASMVGPVMEVVSKMRDDDVEYIIFTCLRAVQRKQGDAWAEVVAPGTTAGLMFQDIELPQMIRLVMEVLKENLAGFSTGLLDETP